MFCKNCGFRMADDHLVCQQCGTRKGDGGAFCDQCGTVLNIGSAFCTNCGKRIQVPVAANNQQFNPNQSNQQFNSTPYSQQTPAQQFRSQAQQPNSQYLPPKKYCRNCGSEVLNSQVICTKCGVKIGEGNTYCSHCAAQTPPGATNCTHCGKSLKAPFDIGKYFSEFGNNIVSVFKTNDIKNLLIENFSNFAAVLIFILMLLPTYYIGNSYYFRTIYGNTFGLNGFSGILFILSLVAGLMKYEPFSVKFMNSKPQISNFYVFLTPALELLSIIIMTISFFVLKGSIGIIPAGFTFVTWIIILLVLASVADAIYLFITKNKKTY